MKTIITSIMTLLVISSFLFAKTMVIYQNDSLSINPISSIERGKIIQTPASLTIFEQAQTLPESASLNSIDSIRFYDVVRTITPEMLYNGEAATHVWTDLEKTCLTLDLRNMFTGFKGEAETDPMDLLDETGRGVAPDVMLRNLTIHTDVDTPTGTSIKLSYKTGNYFFSDSTWTDWLSTNSCNLEVANIGKRYIKLKYTLETTDKNIVPKLFRTIICANYTSAPSYSKSITVPQFANQYILKGAIPFGFEARDQSDVQQFIQTTKLDSIAATVSDEWEKMRLIMDWVARRNNVRTNITWGYYPWDINSVFLADDSIKGHCMSYAQVLVTALTGLGYYARHWAIQAGGSYADVNRVNNHEVVEVWSNKLQKWVYMDPSLDTYYMSRITMQPLSILEMHNIYTNYVLRAGETLLIPASTITTRINNTCAPEIMAVDSCWHYGDDECVRTVTTAVSTWNSCRQHGYTTCGFMQLTERNNFHSEPTPAYPYFGSGIRSYNNWFHCWMDEFTPPYGSQTNSNGRVRDFWYTLNQASIKAKRTGEKNIMLEFGQSQPFFKRYLVSVDSTAEEPIESSYEWDLHDGENIVTVTPEDNWGSRGLSSTIKIVY